MNERKQSQRFIHEDMICLKKMLCPKDGASSINMAFALYCTVITIYELTDL